MTERRLKEIYEGLKQISIANDIELPRVTNKVDSRNNIPIDHVISISGNKNNKENQEGLIYKVVKSRATN